MMDYTQPPPVPDMQQMQMPPPSYQPKQNYHNYHHNKGFNYNKGYNHFKHGMHQDDFDGKRLRKSVMRKTVDYNASIVRALQVFILLFIKGFSLNVIILN